MSKITVNLTEQEIVVPSTSGDVPASPYTGLFTGAGQASGAVIGVGALLLLFAAIGITIKVVNKNKAHRNFAKNTKFHISKAPIIGLSVLVVALVGVGFAAFHAESNTGSASAAGDSGDTLKIAVDDAELNIVPSADGTFGTVLQSVKVTVPTEAGYTLGVYADSAGLVNEENKKSAIVGVEDSATGAALTANTWGFSLEKPDSETAKVWSAMPSSETDLAVLRNVQAATDKDDTTKVYYGVNANTDLPLGKYSTVINYVAVANNPVTYMQDVATIKAELTEVGDTMQAVDKRDDKTYWVTKMADGNIWMAQNLDLDLDSTKTYTSADTNVSANWKPSSSTRSQVSAWEDNITTPESYDPGDVYYYNSAAEGNDILYSSLNDCVAAHHTSDECAHYHVGNYYNWSAAVADNDTSDIATRYYNAPGSICPAGWNLPMGTDANNTAASREYNTLLYAAGVAGSATDSGYATQGFNKIRSNPLYFVRSGYVRDSLLQGGQVGQYWTSTVDDFGTAQLQSFKMIFNSTVLHPAAAVSSTAADGVSVRCMLK